MRKCLTPLTAILAALLLTACVDDSASYIIDTNDHALTVRRQQNYFWKDEADVTLMAARMPECQRLHPLATVAPAAKVKLEVFAAGEETWNLRMGNQLWQIDTQNCNELVELQNDPNADLGQLIGNFSVVDGKLVYLAVANPAAAPAPAPATTTAQ